MLRISTILFLLLISSVCIAQNESINLSGKWKVNLEPKNELITKNSKKCKTTGIIHLPGSLAENGFGYKTTGSDFGILTPEYRYIGKAWYKRFIEIPQNWKNKQVEIFLERVLWESRVFIDGEEHTQQDALGTPHIHKLGKMTPGKHEGKVVTVPYSVPIIFEEGKIKISWL